MPQNKTSLQFCIYKPGVQPICYKWRPWVPILKYLQINRYVWENLFFNVFSKYYHITIVEVHSIVVYLMHICKFDNNNNFICRLALNMPA